MRVDRPGIGTGATEAAPHGRPKLGRHATNEKIPLRAARPPMLRAVKPASLMRSDNAKGTLAGVNSST